MIEWLTRRLADWGYPGIVVFMFLENLFPPIPSELIMPLAGFSAARGDLNLAGVIGAGILGSVLGALPWYALGRLLGRERLKRWADRHGRWLTMTSADVDAAAAWFARHGARAVLFGRLVPAVRTLISVPAGMARMDLPAFLLYTSIGTALWTALLATAGYVLEAEYRRVAHVVNPVGNVVAAILVVAYVYRVIRRRGRAAPG